MLTSHNLLKLVEYFSSSPSWDAPGATRDVILMRFDVARSKKRIA